MKLDQSNIWRVLFSVGGLLYFVGGFNHPRGMRLSDMLVDPAWIPAHATVFVGLSFMTVGLVFFRRSRSTSPKMDRWLLYTIVLAAVETFEMALHTMAFVDAGELTPGAFHDGLSTPVLTLHLWLATLAHTPFAVALIGLIWIGQRERSLGSPWIGWIGTIGAAANGVVMWLVFILQIGGAGILFPVGALAFSLWFVLTGVWPNRRTTSPAATSTRTRSVEQARERPGHTVEIQ